MCVLCTNAQTLPAISRDLPACSAVHLACDDLIATLASTPVDGQDRNGLGLVMRRWTSHQGDVQGAYRIKLTTTALMKLLQARGVLV